MQQTELVNRLDTFFSIGAFEEEDNWRPYMTNDEYATLARFAVPAFLNGSWNGLMLDNATEIEQVYLVVFPAQEVLDTIIAREVACGAPGAPGSHGCSPRAADSRSMRGTPEMGSRRTVRRLPRESASTTPIRGGAPSG